MRQFPTIRRRGGAPDMLRLLGAMRLIGRGVTAGVVAALLVFLAALPDDSPTSPPALGNGMVAIQAASGVASVSRSAVFSVATADAEQPPGDGRHLGALLPTILRRSMPVGRVLAAADLPSPIGSTLLERPPKHV